MYQIVVEYQSDTERKRIEYIFSKYGGKIHRPKGYIVDVENDVYEEVLQELLTKHSPGKVTAYKLEAQDFDFPLIQRTIVYTFNKTCSDVNSFLSYLISRRKGVLLDSSVYDIYEIYTRKGRVELKTRVESNEKSTLNLTLKGTLESVEFIRSEFDAEFQTYGGEKIAR